MNDTKFTSFKKFYPYYLSEHKLRINKILHIIGSLTSITFIIIIIYIEKYKYIPLSILFGYGCAWIGHFVFEKNRPATFKYPIYSFIGDWMMLKDVLIGKIKL
tara:strand:+ start:17308 stop:17616 length:309 start_codon:yes stop_codon:yes gene_type:complete